MADSFTNFYPSYLYPNRAGISVSSQRTRNDVIYCPTDVWHRLYEGSVITANLIGYNYLPGRDADGPGAHGQIEYDSRGLARWFTRKKMGSDFRKAPMMMDKLQQDTTPSWTSTASGQTVAQSSHVGRGNIPTGGNFLYEDGHVEWFKGRSISIGAAKGALGPYVCFFRIEMGQSVSCVTATAWIRPSLYFEWWWRDAERMTLDRRAFLKQVGVGAAGVGLLSFVPGCRTAPQTTGSGKLPRSTPEAEGVSSAGILAFLEAVQHSKHELHGFMLARHGRVVAEGWWSPYGPQLNHTLYSLSKSFTSTAVGFAVAEGKLRVGDGVVPFFPKDLPEKVGDHLAALRVKDLLTMSVGHDRDPTRSMVEQQNWIKAFLGWPIPDLPGTRFLYNSGATYMLSAIVQGVTGQKILDFLQPRLFEPLGIQGAAWETCPRGINVGGWGLSVQTEALAKLGQLYLQKGVWQGRQILPAEWVEEATTFKIQQPAPAKPNRPNDQNDWLQGYCYQFWRCRHHAFRGDGAFGQFMVVMPEQEAVMAITAETSDLQGELDLVWEHLLPAMKEEPLPRDRHSEARLRQALSSLVLTPPEGEASSPLAGRVSGKVFKLDSNEMSMQRASFAFGRDGCLFTLTDSQAEYPIACGIGRWRCGETTLPGTPPRLVSGGAPPRGTKSKVAASGAWVDQGTLQMMLRYYETPHHDTVTCRFEDGKVQIAFMTSIAQMSPTPKDKRPVLHGRVAVS